jgi:hypothetical protein
MNAELAKRIADLAEGTCKSESELADKFEVDEDQVIEACLDFGIERCMGCGWWCESGELEEVDNEFYCGDCR